MRMEAGLDTGPMLAARELSIADRDTAETLHDRLARARRRAHRRDPRRVDGRPPLREPQPHEGVTYAEKIGKAEALIDWRTTLRRSCGAVRAFNPWPVAETRWKGRSCGSGTPNWRRRKHSRPRRRCSRGSCWRHRTAASTWRAGAAACASCDCNWPAANRLRHRNSSRRSGSMEGDSSPHEESAPPVLARSRPSRWRGFCARA